MQTANTQHVQQKYRMQKAHTQHVQQKQKVQNTRTMFFIFIFENIVALVTFKVLQRNSKKHCLLLRLAFKEAKSASEALRGGIWRTSRRTLISSN